MVNGKKCAVDALARSAPVRVLTAQNSANAGNEARRYLVGELFDIETADIRTADTSSGQGGHCHGAAA